MGLEDPYFHLFSSNTAARQHFWPHGRVDGLGQGQQHTYSTIQHRLQRVWPHGWVVGTGLEDPYYIYIHLGSNKKQRDNISGHGRVVGSGLGHRRTLNSTTLTHTWVWPHGWVDGMGLEDHMNGTAIFDTLNDYRHIWPTHTFLLLDFLDKDSNESGLMVGWLGWAWKSIYTYSGLTQGLSASATSQALVGW